ncbi:1,5-anhydro-D-fructose reductase [Halyomorpha halys]|uniref:1,5-anhydro-D-fructose reductase n=1 Tax=Halyomorpha halys TaxID=286706 RepID=UPI0006D4E3EE|nr:1,5-anhydro-D-fructose reductase [Halyomorpha halys]
MEYHPGSMEYHPGSITAGDMRIPVINMTTWKVPEESLKIGLNTSLELGYRCIKTLYSECKAVGAILKEIFENGNIKREDLFISAVLPAIGIRYEDVEYFIKKSLDDLQLDYVDLYEVSSPAGFVRKGDTFVPLDDDGEVLLDLKTDIVKTWKGMEEQVVAGRARSIGMFCFNQEQIQRILNNCTIKPVSLGIEVHVYHQEKELVSFCKKNGIAITAFAPLGCPGLQGVLGAFDGKKKIVQSPLKDPVIKEIAKKHNKQPFQVMLRFLIDYGVSIAIKSVTPKRLKECFDIFDFKLSQEEFNQLCELDRGEDGRRYAGSCGTGVMNFLERHPEFPFK